MHGQFERLGQVVWDGMARPGLSVVIPLYDEAHCLAENVGQVIAGLTALAEPSWELILVDDGSRDATRALASELARQDDRLRLLYHDPNRGKGYAVRRGVLAARGAEILFLDADLSTPVTDVVLLRRALAAEQAEVAIGSRATARSQLILRQPWPREALGRLGNLAIRTLTPSLGDIRDTQCGFKLFRREAARRLFGASRIDGWGFDFEILALARAMGIRVVEVGVSWRHDPHSSVGAGAYLRTFGELLRVRARLLLRH